MSYSSDDDRPLARANGHRLSSSKISRAEDDALDQPVPKQAAKMAGLSVRNGPLEDAMDIDEPATNGASKRKSRTSISKVNYKDDESSDDAAPLAKRQKKQANRVPEAHTTCPTCRTPILSRPPSPSTDETRDILRDALRTFEGTLADAAVLQGFPTGAPTAAGEDVDFVRAINAIQTDGASSQEFSNVLMEMLEARTGGGQQQRQQRQRDVEPEYHGMYA